MPDSSQFGKLYTSLLVKKLYDLGLVRKIMDVGVGCGTYHDLLSPHLPEAHFTGVEAWEPYIGKFDLTNKYDQLVHEDVRKLDFDALGPLDLTIYGDILEHMTKEEAQDVMARTNKICRLILVSIPIIVYPQDEIEGNPFEVHVKEDWSHSEFCSSFPNVLAGFVHDHIGVYCLSSDPEMTAAIKQIHPAISTIVETQLPDDQIKWG